MPNFARHRRPQRPLGPVMPAPSVAEEVQNTLPIVLQPDTVQQSLIVRMSPSGAAAVSITPMRRRVVPDEGMTTSTSRIRGSKTSGTGVRERRRKDTTRSRGRGDVDEESMMGPEARTIMKALGISEDEFRSSAREMRGERRRR